jgi:hypothetical protein
VRCCRRLGETDVGVTVLERGMQIMLVGGVMLCVLGVASA